MFLQQVSYNSGSFSNPFQLFRLLTLKMYIWARCSISALLLLLVHVFKNKKKKLLSKSACFSSLVPRLPHTLHLLLSAKLCWECQHRVRSLHSNEFPRCPSSRRLQISSRYSPVFSQHPFWPNQLFCCVLITVFMKTSAMAFLQNWSLTVWQL